MTTLVAALATSPTTARVRGDNNGVFAPHEHLLGSTFSGSELAKILNKRKINIACVQEIRWVGSRAWEVDGFKLWYYGRVRGKNGVGILVDKDLRELFVEVRRVNDRLIAIKLVVRGYTLSVVSAYAPYVGLDEEVKRRFWEDLDGLVWDIPASEKIIIGEDFNSHIGRSSGGMMGYMVASVLEIETEEVLRCWSVLKLLIS
nr:craniofacial development protein 2-like [Nicotiana tomentosiformis]